jgi:hypothetical protein
MGVLRPWNSASIRPPPRVSLAPMAACVALEEPGSYVKVRAAD